MVVCKFYLQGRCKFGNRCRNEHQKPNDTSTHAYKSVIKFPATYNYERKSSWTRESHSNENNESHGTKQPFNKQKLQESSYMDDITNKMKQSIEEWDKGNIWQFSGFNSDSPNKIISFDDISPEELRCRAYEAGKRNAFHIYAKQVSDALELIHRKWEFMKNPTRQQETYLTSLMSRTSYSIRNIGYSDSLTLERESGSTNPPNMLFGKPVSSVPMSCSSTNSFKFMFDKPTPFLSPKGSLFSLDHLLIEKKPELDHMEVIPAVSSLTSTWFDQPISNTPATASSFSFSLPEKPSDPMPQDSDTIASNTEAEELNVYTPLNELTKQELQEFSDKFFHFGKIPFRPPPKEMCIISENSQTSNPLLNLPCPIGQNELLEALNSSKQHVETQVAPLCNENS